MALLFQKYLEISKGCIINVSCVNGSKPQGGMIGYCMSKAGLEMLTKTTALELAPLGIRVNCVSPAVTDTNLYRYSGLVGRGENDSFMKRAGQNIPL